MPVRDGVTLSSSVGRNPELVGEDEGPDGGAAGAEEPTVHVAPENQLPPAGE
ncbi:DUF5709 domain-containing protein [Streptomyces luteolifulvus]|uniref:DUF5709 domain-containing protein n=1 Tax=Streptomyces luteolifulvus TaxID=2615112 RepID=UPI001CDA2C60|nr:DUF5709 domain-containing protein [Streptomyces luteolifulvus]